MDLEKSYEALFELLWYSQIPCFDIMGVTSNEDEFGKKMRLQIIEFKLNQNFQA